MNSDPQGNQRLIKVYDRVALANFTFSEAAPVWFDYHSSQIRPGTRRHYQNCIVALKLFFGALRLHEIGITHFERYQKARSAGEVCPRKAGPSTINHELNTVSQILDFVGLWAAILPLYRPLRLPRSNVRCALSREDEDRLFRTAESNPRWMVPYCCALLVANTNATPHEIRHLRVRDVELEPPVLHVQGRDIPLNEQAAWAAEALHKRAQESGACSPEHYVLPHRAQNGAQGSDPTRPITSWRGSWNKLCESAGLPGLRMNELSRTRRQDPERVARGSQLLADRWDDLRQELARGYRPHDWDEKPLE